jgi:hypothetical protein
MMNHHKINSKPLETLSKKITYKKVLNKKGKKSAISQLLNVFDFSKGLESASKFT